MILGPYQAFYLCGPESVRALYKVIQNPPQVFDLLTRPKGI